MISTVTEKRKKFNFPQTRYQGSKLKLSNWIWDSVNFLDFETVGDLFGGTGAVSYLFKDHSISVFYNDIMKYNYQTGLALIENCNEKIAVDDLNEVMKPVIDNSKINSIFKDIYFTAEENILVNINMQCYYGASFRLVLLNDPLIYSIEKISICD